MKNNIDVYEVVIKLIGEIKPIGESFEDERRFKQLEIMCDLVDRLLFQISDVIPDKERHECSMKRAGEYADNFFDAIREEMDEKET